MPIQCRYAIAKCNDDESIQMRHRRSKRLSFVYHGSRQLDDVEYIQSALGKVSSVEGTSDQDGRRHFVLMRFKRRFTASQLVDVINEYNRAHPTEDGLGLTSFMKQPLVVSGDGGLIIDRIAEARRARDASWYCWDRRSGVVRGLTEGNRKQICRPTKCSVEEHTCGPPPSVLVQLEAEVRRQRANVARLEAEVSAASARADAHLAELEVSKEETMALGVRLAHLEEALESCQERKRQMELTLVAYKVEIETLKEGRSGELESELRSELDRLRGEHEAVLSDFEQLRRAFEEECSKLFSLNDRCMGQEEKVVLL